jgi:pimeloyl-ACP methyl ester carboxylesterase
VQTFRKSLPQECKGFETAALVAYCASPSRSDGLTGWITRLSAVIACDAVGRGEPLVLLHGVGANRGIWRHVIHELAAQRLVLAPDLPGFGDSPPVGPGFSLDETAGALAEALGERVTAPFDLVGNSLGGAVALILAVQRPELVRRLVLVAPAGFSQMPKLVCAAAGWLSNPVDLYRRLLGSPLMGSEIARRVFLWGTVAAPQHMSAQDARAMLQASRESTRVGAAVAVVLAADLASRLAELDLPLGLIWGARDRIVPIATLRSILAVRPQAVVETIPDAAHVPQFERPAEFVSALSRVLTRL